MSLTRMNWRARQLVGPAVNPRLTTLEDNIENFVRSHVHGQIDRTEGDEVIYEAEPLDPALIPISDPLNPANTTLKEHLDDESLHNIEAANAPDLRIFTGTCDLKLPVSPGPDATDGSVSQSWYSNSAHTPSLVKPIHNMFKAVWSPYGALDGDIANAMPLTFQGAKQREGLPTPFKALQPRFGRVLERSQYLVNTSGMVSAGSLPDICAFDYMWFPYRTWFHLYSGVANAVNNPSFIRTVVKRYRSASFPDDFRAENPTLAKLFWQLRSEVGHSLLNADTAMRQIYWPKEDPFDEIGYPIGALDGTATVPTVGQYGAGLDPGNPYRQFVGVEDNLQYPTVNSDFSNFQAASVGFGARDMWREFKSASGAGGSAYYGSDQYGQWVDWMYPLSSVRNWGLRVKWAMHDDNQVDVFPFIPWGWLIILPYGYLPLYIDNSITFGALEGDLAKIWANTQPTFAPCGSVIEWQATDGFFDLDGPIKVPRLVSSPGAGAPTYAYPYPKAINLDYTLVVPE